jgi:hypothetical protein
MSFRLLVVPEAREDPPSRLSWRIAELGAVVQVDMVHDGFEEETATYRLVSSEGLVLRRLQAMLERGGRPVAVWKVAFDCAHPARLARFWAAALGYQTYFREEQAGWAESTDARLFGPDLYFQRVPEGKAGKNRLHLDLTVDNRESQVRRLINLGAREVATNREGQETWTVMQDPEGNEFCLQ